LLEHLPEEYATLWTKLARSGYDLYRDLVSTPAFLRMLPPIAEKSGLDIGCGEGYNTRQLSMKGAKMHGIDISPTFIEFAKNEAEDLHIEYNVGNALDLPFQNSTFDFCTSFFTFHEIENFEKALSEAYRVIKQGGFLQFVITHPCYWTPSQEWLIDENGKKRALACSGYFESQEGSVIEWMFDGVDSSVNPNNLKFRSAFFRRSISKWLNTSLKVGFIIDLLNEPKASKSAVSEYGVLDGSSQLPFFLIIRLKK